MPPFTFLVLWCILALILLIAAKNTYKYTYHCGYLLALVALIDLLCLCYGVYYIYSLYVGDYAYNDSRLPLIVLAACYGYKLILSTVFILGVVCNYYLKDIRYR